MRHQHWSSRKLGGAAVAALMLAAGGAPSPVAAEEAGQWFGRAVLVATSSKTVGVGDRAGHTVSVTDMDGVVFNGDGRPFLDKARYQVVDITDAGASSYGYKTFTDADGSKVFARYTLREARAPEFRGTFEFIGGTGRYQGITGRGEYRVVFVSDAALWDELRGEYRIPTTTATSPGATPPTVGMGGGGANR
jgi:hypothetical protein